jgi:hypothetical protein
MVLRTVIAGFDQLNVKAWLMRRIQIALISGCRCGGIPARDA